MNERITDCHQDIREAQEYLTIKKDGEIQLIVGLDYLSENHSRQEIVRFLKDYLHEKEKQLKFLILGDKSSNKIDHTVAVMFRLHMAITIIEKRMEVNNIVRLKQGTTESSHVRKRNRRRHSRARQRKDAHNDGKDWQSGYGSRCAA
ncbi:MAG: hypothetical protein ACOYOS_04485 [Syntrophales bacterium]